MKKSFTLSDWIARLKSGKDIYHARELERLSGLSREALHRALQRLRKNKIIYKLGKGFYANSFITPRLEQIACLLYPPAYISLESALFSHGILEQTPHVLTCLTTNKTKQFTTDMGDIHYSHIKKSLFFGYRIEDRITLASPEKAALDFVYIQLKGGNKIALDEWDWDNLRCKEIKSVWDAYPKTVKAHLMKFLPPYE